MAFLLVLRTPSWIHWSPDCDAKFLAVKSIRWDHGLRYDVPYPGKALDPSFRAVALGDSYWDLRGG
ncbi:MAG: hypothetical protein ACREJX_10535 [Polyangiaceae bacterium]